jgi:hypothetical protein
MKRFGLSLGLVGVLLLVIVGWINRPVADSVEQPTPAALIAAH